MGGPLKVTRDGKSTFVCCKGCLKELQANPEKYFGDRAAAGKDEHGHQH
jgi:YHS domain-containing protein